MSGDNQPQRQPSWRRPPRGRRPRAGPDSATLVALVAISAALLWVCGRASAQTEAQTFAGDRTSSVPELYLVKDINPAGGDAGMYSFATLNWWLFFNADDGSHGRELWKSDGTEANTLMVKDIVTGTAGSGTNKLTHSGGQIFFDAYDSTKGWELWKSDGTQAGTQIVKDIYPGWGWSEVSDLTDVNGTLFFTADDGVHGIELWKSDGTEAGTVLVKDIVAESGGSLPSDLYNLDGVLFFTAADDVHGRELWKSDGTAAGTMLVKDIYSGPSGSDLYDFTAVNGTLFFTFFGHKVWKSDGTQDGTVMVPGDYEWAEYLTAVNDTLFFCARDDTHGRELWKSDGTEAGTAMVKDIHPTGNSWPANLIDVAGTLFFNADDGIHSGELWVSDGTEAGTVLVKDINPNSDCTSDGENPGSGSFACTAFTHDWGVYPQTVFAGQLWFRADDGSHGAELWTSDGTEAGTVLVKDINTLAICDRYGENPGSGSSPCGSDLRQIDPTANTFFVVADDGIHGRELWALEVDLFESYVPFVRRR